VRRLSTRDVPPSERLSFVHDFVSRNVARLEFTPETAGPPEIELAALMLPGDINVGEAFYTPIRGARTRELLQDGKHGYFVTVHTSDYEFSVEGKEPVKVAAGDVTILNQGLISEFRLPHTRVDVLSIAHAKLAPLVPGIDLKSHHCLPRSAAGADLLLGYAGLLRNTAPHSERGAELAAAYLCDLVALVLDQRGARDRSEGAIRAARLDLAKTHIGEGLGDPELTVERVARRQGVSVRYIHKLFESEGASFSEYVRDRRVELAYRMLRNAPKDRKIPISTIALDCGFGDISNFNRTFRRRYGITPSELLAQSLKRRES
jgi:AraC-like DNA-binding protein